MAESKLAVSHVEKFFKLEHEFLHVLDDITLEIPAGSFVSIVGASGCGKSTLIRMIAGLETPSAGDIQLDGKRISEPSLSVGMVFQEARLLPWLTVEKNIAFGIDSKTLAKEERMQKVQELISLTGLNGFAKALPKQLSGGMQQRVAIARGLINTPKVLLLDEPFGALDAFTRMTMQTELLNIWRKEKNTMVLVTHDIDEAIFLSTSIVILSERPGRIKEVIPVTLPTPRDRSSSEFLKIRRRVLQSFFNKDEEMLEYYL